MFFVYYGTHSRSPSQLLRRRGTYMSKEEIAHLFLDSNVFYVDISQQSTWFRGHDGSWKIGIKK